VPEFDATVVKRLVDAGAVLLGKLQLTEGAFAKHHPSIVAPRNPWNPDYYAARHPAVREWRLPPVWPSAQ
jgi:amidase